MFGKLAGVVREILLASLFGTSGIVAAVRAAQAATLVPVNFFTADILSAGFLPLYCRYMAKDQARANTLFLFVSLLLFVASILVVSLISLGAHLWVGVLVPGFGPQERAYTIELLDVFAVGVPFYIAGTLFSYREMGHNSYSMSSARATLQSVGMIIGTLGAFFLHAPTLLAWGFTAAYIAYCLWGLHRMIKRQNGVRQGVTGGLLREIAAEFWTVVKPLVLLPAFLQTNIVVERAVASLLGVDVAASLDYAKFITETGVLLFAVPIGLASLSVISRIPEQESKMLLMRIVPGLLLISVPVSAALSANSHVIVAFIYQRGEFGHASTDLTTSILSSFAIGFWAQVVSYVLIKALSARLRNFEVFKLMAMSLVANVIINLAFFRFAGPRVLGLASGCYGLVLTIGAARALGILRLVSVRASILIASSIAYWLLGSTFEVSNFWWALFAIFIFLVYWTLIITLVPVLRDDARALMVALRTRAQPLTN